TLPVRDSGMPDADTRSETLLEAAMQLRRESDLGDEEDHSFAFGKGGPRELEIDLCLSAAGDAMKERHAETPPPRFFQSGERGLLFVGQGDPFGWWQGTLYV